MNLLRHPALRRLLPGLLVSALGDGMSLVAVAWLAVEIAPPGQAGIWAGLAVAAYALPATLGAAVLARFMRALPAARLVAADAWLRAVAQGTVAILAVSGGLSPLVYVVLLALSSLLHAWGHGGTYTLVAQLLPPDQRLAGNALLSTFSQAAVVVGPALAGALAALAGPGWVIAIDATSFAVLAVSCRLVPAGAPPRSSEKGGWRTILDRRDLLGLIVVTCVFFFLYGPVEVALPVHVAHDLHGSARLLGLYWTVFGVGATAGALSASALKNRPPAVVVVAIIIGWGIALLPLGLTDAILPGLIGFAVGGLIYGPFNAIVTALIQTATPPDALSRVLATRAALTIPAASLGTLLGGPLVTAIGARPTMLASAVTTIAFGCLVAIAAARYRKH